MGRVGEAALKWCRYLEIESQNEKAVAFLASAGVTAMEAWSPESEREKDG